MSKYKLIREYKNSSDSGIMINPPKLGTIVRFHEDTFPEYYDIKTGVRYTAKEIEGSPYYWVKLGDNDYKIMTYEYNNKLYNLNSFGEYVTDLNNNISDIILDLMDSHAVIYRVRRLSDGQDFTIGDKLNKYNATIREFIYDNKNDEIKVITDANSESLVASYMEWGLNMCELSETPMFRTVDGVEKYEGDTCWVITKPIAPTITPRTVSKKLISSQYVIFDSKENAEKYKQKISPGCD